VKVKSDLPTMRLALIGLLIFAVKAVLSVQLKTVLTSDSQQYIWLSELIFKENWTSNWDFLRTPLYPLAIKIFSAVLGKGVLALDLINVTLSSAGIILLASMFWPHRLAVAAISCLGIIFSDQLTYENMALTEIGTFFFIALTTRILLAERHILNHPFLMACLLGLAITIGYYWRPTILYLSLPAAFFFLCLLIRNQNLSRVGIALSLALVLAIPSLASIPWRSQLKKGDRTGDMYLFGAISQAAIPETIPGLDENFLKDYRHGISEAKNNFWGLEVAGLNDSHVYPLLHRIRPLTKMTGKEIFIYSVKNNTLQYAAGVLRTTAFYFGFLPKENENKLFAGWVGGLTERSPSVLRAPTYVNQQENIKVFDNQPSHFLIRGLFKIGIPAFAALVLLANIMLLIALPAAIKLRNYQLLVLSVIPLYWYAIHAVILQSINRQAFPCYLIVMAAAIKLLLLVAEKKGHKRLPS
jgi:hypothetical protein